MWGQNRMCTHIVSIPNFAARNLVVVLLLMIMRYAEEKPSLSSIRLSRSMIMCNSHPFCKLFFVAAAMANYLLSTAAIDYTNLINSLATVVPVSC
jgi:hypothetical protein